MSKVANMLNMVQILKDGKIHSLKNLSYELEVSIRMIRQYKVELEQAGIYIKSVTGKYGGYKLEEQLNNIDIGLTESEIIKLEQLYMNLKDEKDKEIILKINTAYTNNKQKQSIKKLNNMKYQNKELTEVYKIIRKAINESRKLKITFYSVNSGTTKRIIHPAEMFEYLDKWYVAGFCELRNEIRMFKLEDIKDFKLLEEKYNQKFTIKKEMWQKYYLNIW